MATSLEEFQRQYIGKFPMPTERDIALHNRVKRHYEETEFLGNRQALVLNKQLTDWWNERGYTREEFNRAKRNCLNVR